ncbi:hypothetical protein EGW08_011537 [Elysia chlorotica]|uniref:Uncharacterized protein n=1 Tax=Elysia chlorotica TaxID=188477 RepID=A0A3S0ZK19_ELYCH|nr:hypothetical protein EGW08_011537 [Elysia chlorotica]
MNFLTAVVALTLLVIGVTIEPSRANKELQRPPEVSDSDRSIQETERNHLAQPSISGPEENQHRDALDKPLDPRLVNTEQTRNTSQDAGGYDRTRSRRAAKTEPAVSSSRKQRDVGGASGDIKVDPDSGILEKSQVEGKKKSRTREKHAGKTISSKVPGSKAVSEGSSSSDKNQFGDIARKQDPEVEDLDLGPRPRSSSAADSDDEESFYDFSSGFGDPSPVMDPPEADGSSSQGATPGVTEHQPLGAEFAKLQEEVLRGVVPTGGTSGFEHGPPNTGTGYHDDDTETLDDFGPDELPEYVDMHPLDFPHGLPNSHNTHPLNFPHDLPSPINTHHLDLHHGVPSVLDLGVPGADIHPHPHPHSGDIPLAYPLGDPLDHSGIEFDFGALDLDGHSSKLEPCFGQCMCNEETVKCFWCNLTQVPAGINPATKKL